MLSNIAQLAYRAKFLLNANSPTLLTAVGVGGTVATAVLTGKATFKAAEVIQQKELAIVSRSIGRIISVGMTDEGLKATGTLDESLVETPISKLEKIRLVWPYYIPPFVAGSITVTSIIAANKISSGRIAALAVASGLSERALQEYKDKIVEKLGDKQSTALNDEIAQDKVTKNPPTGTETLIMGTGDVLCQDSISGRYFHSTVEQIRHAENNANAEMIHFDCVSLTYFYDELGLSPTAFSDMMGWNLGNKLDLTFSAVKTDDNRPCLVINYTKMPSVDYDRFQRG